MLYDSKSMSWYYSMLLELVKVRFWYYLNPEREKNKHSKAKLEKSGGDARQERLSYCRNLQKANL